MEVTKPESFNDINGMSTLLKLINRDYDHDSRLYSVRYDYIRDDIELQEYRRSNSVTGTKPWVPLEEVLEHMREKRIDFEDSRIEALKALKELTDETLEQTFTEGEISDEAAELVKEKK